MGRQPSKRDCWHITQCPSHESFATVSASVESTANSFEVSFCWQGCNSGVLGIVILNKKIVL